MDGRWNAVIASVIIAMVLLIACGHKDTRARSNLNIIPPGSEQVDGGGGASNSPLPSIFELDGNIKVNRQVSADETITSQGWEAALNDQTGTNGTSALNVETAGTTLTLRALAPGEYAYAVYGQYIGVTPKPRQTLINSLACDDGGGVGIQVSYYVGIADYSMGAWRWFGPFGEEDVLVTVNSANLRSRFKSPSDNYYLCVLAANGSKAASAMPGEGLISAFPLDPSARASSAQGDDPGGITIEEVVTTIADDLLNMPMQVVGLGAAADTSAVHLTWNTSIDPDVYVYQVLRDDLDDEAAPELLGAVDVPLVNFDDTTGIPGKNYLYLVRARNSTGFSGYAPVSAIRTLRVPNVIASDDLFDNIALQWNAVEGATGYRLYRSEANDFADAVVMEEVGAASTSFIDESAHPLGKNMWYWVQALGEDENGMPGTPDSGMRVLLNPAQVSATDGTYPDRVELVWGAEPLAEKYFIYRGVSETDANPVKLGEVTAPQVTYADSTGPWQTPRFYSIASVIEGIEQPRGQGDFGFRYLATPGNVTATDGTYDARITVSWDEVSFAASYNIYRDTVFLATVDAPSTTYDDQPVPNEITYSYQVTAAVPDGEGDRSAADIGFAALSPTVNSVSPDVSIRTWSEQFVADVSGTLPLTYSWDFGGGATPNTSSDVSPVVILNGAGLYNVSLTVTNSSGEDTYTFTYVIEAAIWAMKGRNPSRTGRSPFVGPQTNNIRWEFPTEAAIYSSPAIACDGTIYFGSDDNYLYALYPDGEEYWRYLTGGPVKSSPAIADDGTIYVGSGDHYLHAVYPDGSPKWKFPAGDVVDGSPIIAPDGTIYVGSYTYESADTYLYAINPDGTEKWRYDTGGAVGTPAISPDGTIYVGSTCHGFYFFELNPNGSLKGSLGMLYNFGDPVVGDNGTIYIGGWEGKVYALNPGFDILDWEQTLKWELEGVAGIPPPSLTISADGTIYIDIFSISDLESVGFINWTYDIPDGGVNMDYSGRPYAVDADKTVYLGTGAISDNGTEVTTKWIYDTEYNMGAPVISADGAVYVGSTDGTLYAFGDPL